MIWFECFACHNKKITLICYSDKKIIRWLIFTAHIQAFCQTDFGINYILFPLYAATEIKTFGTLLSPKEFFWFDFVWIKFNRKKKKKKDPAFLMGKIFGRVADSSIGNRRSKIEVSNKNKRHFVHKRELKEKKEGRCGARRCWW